MISGCLQYEGVSTEYSPLPDFLDSMRESGAFDSEGSITVNRRRAERMLAQYRLQSPYQYVLKFIQALVEAEVTEIHVFCDKRKVRLRCPGQFCTLEEWQKYLEDSGEQGTGVEGRFLHLQVALNALDRLEPTLVTLLCVSEEDQPRFGILSDLEALQLCSHPYFPQPNRGEPAPFWQTQEICQAPFSKPPFEDCASGSSGHGLHVLGSLPSVWSRRDSCSRELFWDEWDNTEAEAVVQWCGLPFTRSQPGLGRGDRCWALCRTDLSQRSLACLVAAVE